jgi:hypothetical protein
MTKTLEEIKGMNIPVGTPIELSKNDHKKLVYFAGIENEYFFVWDSMIKDNPEYYKLPISPSVIQDLKVLEYKK